MPFMNNYEKYEDKKKYNNAKFKSFVRLKGSATNVRTFETKNGKGLSFAMNMGDKEDKAYINVSFFGDKMVPYLEKNVTGGTRLIVEGYLNHFHHKDGYVSWSIVGQSCDVLVPYNYSDNNKQSQRKIIEDDIPF